jgi:negative regulator of flagellin synthesis FlgM
VAVNLTGLDLSGAAIGTPPKPTASQGAKTGSKETAAKQAEVSITTTASLLAHLEQSLAAQPAVDQARVDAVSKSLAAGTYQIKPEQIASGLLHTERGLAPLPLREI